MSRKRSDAAIRAFHDRFVEGACGRFDDVDEALAERVWSMVVGFSGFGFPKAHGAAFGLLAYQSAWLREHYGPEFLCALLDEQPMGFYPPDALTHEAQRRGIEVLAPDVNASAVGCTVVDPPGGGAAGAVRLGLGYVLGVRADEVAALVAAREAEGPFRSLDDLASRAGAGRPALEQLAWSGACDALVTGGGRGRRAPRRARPAHGAVAPGRRGPAAGGRRGGHAARAAARPAGAARAGAAGPLGGDARRLRHDDRQHRRPPARAAARRAGCRRGELERRRWSGCATGRRSGSAVWSSRASAPGPPRA